MTIVVCYFLFSVLNVPLHSLAPFRFSDELENNVQKLEDTKGSFENRDSFLDDRLHPPCSITGRKALSLETVVFIKHFGCGRCLLTSPPYTIASFDGEDTGYLLSKALEEKKFDFIIELDRHREIDYSQPLPGIGLPPLHYVLYLENESESTTSFEYKFRLHRQIIDMIEFFLWKGVDINQPSAMGSPLSVAAFSHELLVNSNAHECMSYDIVKFLLDRGADVNGCFYDDDKVSAEMAEKVHLGGVLVKNKFTPLQRALSRSNFLIASFLISQGANIYVETSSGENLLHLIVPQEGFSSKYREKFLMNKDLEYLFDFLVKKGVDPYQKNHEGQTPYDCGLKHQGIIDRYYSKQRAWSYEFEKGLRAGAFEGEQYFDQKARKTLMELKTISSPIITAQISLLLDPVDILEVFCYLIYRCDHVHTSYYVGLIESCYQSFLSAV